MVSIKQCFCVGKFKGTSKTGKPFTISFFTLPFEITDKGCEGSSVFQTFDDAEVGETYECVRSHNGYQLLKMD